MEIRFLQLEDGRLINPQWIISLEPGPSARLYRVTYTDGATIHDAHHATKEAVHRLFHGVMPI